MRFGGGKIIKWTSMFFSCSLCKLFWSVNTSLNISKNLSWLGKIPSYKFTAPFWTMDILNHQVSGTWKKSQMWIDHSDLETVQIDILLLGPLHHFFTSKNSIWRQNVLYRTPPTRAKNKLHTPVTGNSTSGPGKSKKMGNVWQTKKVSQVKLSWCCQHYLRQKNLHWFLVHWSHK